MTEEERRLDEAFRLLCMWTGTNPSRRNTVISIGLDDILNGRQTERVNRAWDLARFKRGEDERRFRKFTSPERITLMVKDV